MISHALINHLFFPPTVHLLFTFILHFPLLSSPFLRCVLGRLRGNSGAPVSVSLRSRLEKQSITPKSSPDPAPKSQPSCLIGPLPCQSPKSIVSDGRMALSSCWNNMKDFFSTWMQICVCVEPNGCVFPRVVGLVQAPSNYMCLNSVKTLMLTLLTPPSLSFSTTCATPI